ncbi:MAG: glycoside hydrolase family 3 protein [Bacillota bacterium]
MTARERVAQLFMLGFPGPEADLSLLDLIHQQGLGGVIFFARNATSPGQLRALSEHLQDANRLGPELPLLIAIDQEGGLVARLNEDNGFITPPGAMLLGAANNPVLTHRSGAYTAAQLRQAGVNVNLAPVLDVNNNPQNPVIGVRSFGQVPEFVAQHGVAYLRGLQGGGVVAVGKHFPGHGDTSVDSHLALPRINHPLSRLESVELLPFRRAIGAGLMGVMTAHVTFPALAADGRPATLSPAVLTGLLRERMGFDGLILTDCMEMKAISDNYGPGEAAVMAIEAGADLVLISHTWERQLAAIEAVVQAVEEGRLSEARIEASLARVYRAKRWVARACEIPPGYSELPLEAARRGITVIRRGQPGLPLQPGRLLTVEFRGRHLTGVEEDPIKPGDLAAHLRELLPGSTITSLLAPLVPAPRSRETIELAAASADLVVWLTREAVRYPEQAQLVKGLARAKPGLGVALRTPYDARVIPELATYLAAYDGRPTTMRALAEVLAGAVRPTGTLPVTL